MAEFEWGRLRRRPDAEAENLYASDAADRLIIDTVASMPAGPAELVVIGDDYGALTLAAADALGHAGMSGPDRAGTARSTSAGVIRVHQDPIVAERALKANAEELGLSGTYRSCALGADLVTGARLVLLRLPKSLDALDEIAGVIAADAHPDVTVVAGGMQKHMTPAMNEVLLRHFERVDVGRARQKARVLTVRTPRRNTDAVGHDDSPSAWPRRRFHADIDPGLWVSAHGGAFAGTRIDIGTRFLLDRLDEAAPRARTAVDLACGTGVLASALALRRPGVQVVASDQSAAATASALATAEANGIGDRIEVRREDAGEGIPDASADLVLLNPPFHNGAALDLRIGRMLVAAAARILAPGGELWTVYNSGLDYRPALRRIVGPTRQADRNRKFTITASARR
jgi:16S rRNA (guanine1207-N2)-methyltransferase